MNFDIFCIICIIILHHINGVQQYFYLINQRWAEDE